MGRTLAFKNHLPALGGFLVLAVAYTWPLGRYLTSRIAHDPGDPVLNVWILWWNAQALPFTERWWNPPVFYPLEGAFALSEHLFGIALFTTPLQWAGASALTSYNLALIVSFTLSAFFTFLLVRYLLLREGARGAAVVAGALCAGAAFGFAPYRASHLSHLQVLTTQWMPLVLLAMHAYLDGGRRAWLLVAGGAWVVQALSNGYYLLFFPVLVALWLAWFVDWRREWRRGLALVGAFATSSLLLVPGLLQYLAVHGRLGLRRQIDEMRMFSADPESFLAAPHSLAFWPDLGFGKAEAFLFPGVTAVLLLLAAGVQGRRRPSTIASAGRSALGFYAAATLMMWWLAFGPAVPDEPLASAWYRPYTLLTYLPGFGGLRVPARIAILGYLCLAVAAGLALARLLPSTGRARRGLVILVFAGLFVESWPVPMPLVRPPGRVLLPEVSGAAVLELAADNEQVNVWAMYRAMDHGYPLINGYSGHVPRHYRLLRDALRRGDHTVLQVMAARRPLLVSIHADDNRDGHFQEVVATVPGTEFLGVTSAGQLFRIPPQPLASAPPAGAPLPYALSEPAAEIAQLDLGSPQVVRLIEFPLRWRYELLHGRMEVRASDDGETWTNVWLDWTGGLALRGALEDQLEVPLRIVLPDVRARYLRVRPLPRVLMEEIAVYGPG
jgi:hypothetical protein